MAIPMTPGPLATERDRARRMERLTWSLVVGAFVAWLGLAAVGGGWAASFIQSAAAPAPSTLEAVSGVVLYREADQRGEVSAQQGQQLFEGDDLITSFGSKAALRVPDGSALEAFPNTRIRVDAARRGHFNAGATRAAFSLSTGAVRLLVPGEGTQDHSLQVTVPQGRFDLAPGEYTVRVGSEAARVSVWRGAAFLTVGAGHWEASAGQKLVLTTGAGSPQLENVLENIVANGDFSQGFEGWEPWEDRERGRPDVPGRLDVVSPNAPEAPGAALRVWRNSEVDAHNETGLRQRLERDVTGARAVVLRARVRVDAASLSGGGYLGSEYPMMIRVRLRDSRDNDVIWTQGFYYANPENRPVPVGQQVVRGEWVELSTDLTGVVNQPSTIEAIEVFGAGHTFEAFIADVQLLVD